MANDVTFVRLSIERAIRIGTTAGYASSDFHTCLMTEEAMEIQVESHVAGQLEAFNNTCLIKHPKFSFSDQTSVQRFGDALNLNVHLRTAADDSHQPPGFHTRNYSRAELMRRVFVVDVLECPRCDGRMRILAVINPPDAIR